MEINYLFGQCGAVVVSDLYTSTPTQIVRAVKRHHRAAFVVFSDNVQNGHGVKLAEYIKKKELGKVVETSNIVNRRTGRVIQMWVWERFKPATKKQLAKGFAENM